MNRRLKNYMNPIVKLGGLIPVFIVTTVLANPLALDDWKLVIKAVERANLGGSGTIRLASHSTIVVDQPLPLVTAIIVVEGNGTTLQADMGYEGPLVRIDTGGNLVLQDLSITGFTRKTSDVYKPETISGLIENHGVLKLSRVTMAENPRCRACIRSLSLLDNHGQAFLNNVTLFRNTTLDIHTNDYQTANVRNCGFMQILNSTFVENRAGVAGNITPIHQPVPAAITAYISGQCGPGVFEIGNSLFENFWANCGSIGELVDLGGNLDSDGSCGFDPATNVINRSAQVARFGPQGGLVPTVGLQPNSAAIDIGVDSICSATDARLALRPVPSVPWVAARCDAGAYEFGGDFGNAGLAANGMSGLWYNSDTKGHYVHVMRVAPDRVYVNWTTFDQDANQLWIYAVATTSDSRSFTATAYINSGGFLLPGGPPVGHTVEEWGNIEIELESCLTGHFRYRANDSAIGEGEFALNRLAVIEGIDCASTDLAN